MLTKVSFVKSLIILVSLKPLEHWFSSFKCVSESPGGFVKPRLLGPTSGRSDSVDTGKGPRTCISNKFPVGADVACAGTTL